MVYSHTFAPGDPMTWALRIAGHGDRLVDLGRNAVRSDERPATAGAHMRFFVGAPTAIGDVVLVPLRWDLPGSRLTGEFRLSRPSPDRTEISLRATYDGATWPDDRHASVARMAKALVDGIPSAFGPALPMGTTAPAPIAPTAAPPDTR